MHKYFNPGRLQKLIDKVLPYTMLLTIIFMASGLYFALISSPPDYQQGEFVRIMYAHVPAAWMALGVYVFIAAMSASLLIWRNPLSTIIANASAPFGAMYALICLITGSIWGKPIWGTWWVWDARLTSMLILFFIYIAYIALYNAYEDKEHAGKISAIFALLGLINIPIIKFSVEWWNTLHQPASIIRSGGIAIDGAMLRPLLLMFAGFIFFFIFMVCIKIKTAILEKKALRSY